MRDDGASLEAAIVRRLKSDRDDALAARDRLRAELADRERRLVAANRATHEAIAHGAAQCRRADEAESQLALAMHWGAEAYTLAESLDRALDVHRDPRVRRERLRPWRVWGQR